MATWVDSSVQRTRRRRSRSGFTLIETSLALIIIAVGVLALVEAQQAFIKSNDWSSHAATGNYLANEIRELMRKLPNHDPVTGVYLEGTGSPVLRGWGPDAGELGVEDFDDIDDFDGLSLTFTGTAGLSDNDLPGPIDGFGAVIPEIGNDGAIVVGENNQPLPLRGWSQRIRVVKVDPFDPSIEYLDDQVLATQPNGFTGLEVDEFPLKVSVDVFFRGFYDTQDSLVTTVTWIMP
jgi:prepilin-type N-terminal cleavage/methylation domain-containing protein